MDRNTLTVRTLAAAVALAGAGCRDASSPPLSPTAPTAAASPAAIAQGVQAPDLATLARVIPGFGGFYLDAGVPTVYLLDPAARGAAERALGRAPRGRVQEIHGRYAGVEVEATEAGDDAGQGGEIGRLHPLCDRGRARGRRGSGGTQRGAGRVAAAGSGERDGRRQRPDGQGVPVHSGIPPWERSGRARLQDGLPVASPLGGLSRELAQLAPVPPHKLFVDVAVGVIPQFADLVSTELEHHARPLVHDVLGIALEPGTLADLDDHAVVGVVPVAPYVLVAPIRGAEAGLAVPQRVQHPLPPSPFAADGRGARHPIHDVVGESPAHSLPVACEEGLLVRPGALHPVAHTLTSSTSSGSGRAFALRPARSIGLSISALWRSRMVQKSSERSSSSYAASRSVSLSFTWRTLFCMSSASQPRECAMNGNGGNTKPSSDQKVNMPPATAWMLSCPPVMINAATLFLMSTRLWIVIWFCTQFNRSIIL